MEALRHVQEPELGGDLVTRNMIRDLVIDGSKVAFQIELTTPACPLKDEIESRVHAALDPIGVTSVELTWGASVRRATPRTPEQLLPGVKNVLAIASGKGGVGKSTVAVNLAVGLHRAGARVGLMDGDIYGPSMPTLLGIKGQQPTVNAGKIIPFHVHGIHAITIGALVEQDKPLIWRGPMAHGAFKQLFSDNTDWPELDYLIVDLPPGTGDVPLTLCQLLPLTGAVVVATPQQVALDDAVRAVRMFQQLGAPILGIVENMSYMTLPDGTIADIFGRGGAEKAAQELAIPFLGALPLYPELRANSDAGDPTRNFTTNPKLADALNQIVQNLLGQINLRNLTSPTPELNII